MCFRAVGMGKYDDRCVLKFYSVRIFILCAKFVFFFFECVSESVYHTMISMWLRMNVNALVLHIQMRNPMKIFSHKNFTQHSIAFNDVN